MRFWRQAFTLFLRDLRMEGRSGEILGVVFPFAVVALVAVPLTTDASRNTISTLGPPVFWLILLLLGMHVSLRNTGSESLTQRRHLALSGADPVARFVGRSMATTVLLGGVAIACLPTMVIMYDPDSVSIASMTVPLALFTPGLAMLTTLIGDISAGLRLRSALVPMVVAPLAIPLVVPASQASRSLSTDGSSLAWILLLIVADLLLGIVGVLMSETIEETTL